VTDRFAELDRIFEEALELPEEDRPRFLAERCADPEIRVQIERLLDDASGVDTLLPPAGALEGPLGEAFALELGGSAPDEPSAGRRIDDFELVRQLGRGGMGEVWEAEQLAPVRRRVALKLIRPGLDSERLLARFESERQALALMNHPHIARVFDGGTTSGGRPYFVMEYVSGEPITSYCDRVRASIDERLSLYVEVCEGVQHAHHRGIVHRDLKPSNILVSLEDGRPGPKIIDFGIARALTDPLSGESYLTEYGEFVGTPEYMSPEQAGGDPADVDTRADVYALGVLLHELLAGARPLESETLRNLGVIELLRVVREVEPPPAGDRLEALPPDALERTAAQRGETAAGLVRRVRGDLEWIVAKAIEKERERRYGSPQELAADIRRHLADEPVSAGPPSTGYRLRKLVRRHRGAVAAGLLVALSLVAGAGLSLWQAIRATRAERAARAEAETARQVSDFLIGLFERSDPGIAQGSDPTAKEILERGRQKLETELAGQPLIRARLQATIGGILRKLGHYEEARPLIESSLELRLRELPEGHPDRAHAVLNLARLEAEVAHDERAEELFREAQAGLAQALGPEHPETLDARVELADVVKRRGRYEEAVELYRASADALARVVGPEDKLVGHAWSGAGNALYRLGRLEEAEQAHRRALAIYEKTVGPDHPSVALVLGNLTGTLAPMGRYEEAKAAGRRALEIHEKVYGPEHRFVATALTNLATVYGGNGELDEAERLLLRGLEIRKKVFGESSPETGIDYKNLGHLAMLKADYEAAESYLERSLEIDESRLGPEHPRVAWNLGALGGLALRRARWDEAERLLARALELLRAKAGAPPAEIARIERDLARTALGQGRVDIAAEHARAAEEALAASGPENPTLPSVWQTLGDVLTTRGDLRGAAESYERSIALNEKLSGPEHPELAETLVGLATVRLREGNAAAASELCRRALAIAEKAYGAAHPDAGRAWRCLGEAEALQGDLAVARESLRRAQEILAGRLGAGHPDAAAAARSLAGLPAG